MRISSSFLPLAPWEKSGRQANLMVFDTRVNTKRLIVGIVVCDLVTTALEERQFDPIDLDILGCIFMHRSFNYPNSRSGKNVVGAMASIENAQKEVQQLLSSTPDHSGLMLLCKNEGVCKAVCAALCLDFQPGIDDISH